MKTFVDYQKLREMSALDVGKSAVGGTALSNDEEGEMGSLFKVARLGWDRYRGEMVSFLQKLAHKDPDIQEEFSKIKDSGFGKLSSAVRRIKPEPDIVGRPQSDFGASDLDQE